MIDIHTHIIPAIDDGPKSLSDSVEGLKELKSRGVTALIATPHLNASALEDSDALLSYLDCADERCREMLEAASESGITLDVRRGFEIMLDRPRPNLSNPRLRLAGTRFVLVEFPWSAIPPNSEIALSRIISSGYTPIISHPERYDDVADGSAAVAEWRKAGALLQVSLGCLAGYYGRRARQKAWSLLEKGFADYLAGDFHGRGQHPFAAAKRAVLERGGAEQFEILTLTNPGRLLADLRPVDVPPITAPPYGWLDRFLGGK
jgi:protein-tyrosine phosphatase